MAGLLLICYLWVSLKPSPTAPFSSITVAPETVYLLLYVDDIVVTASSQPLLYRVIDALKKDLP